ncbi:helix-turn-helix domain-containing protein [Facklamia sp. DSM 111018]|uniref:Helix-turn-helix domain-containing protein n=1 Tax=Facklamia lactis TaxID=2749967 RepID=A0ABS0LTG3_9LACT|nr:M protein trans-acting positive regulator PRD domain-containing protein [Facklamia lactis]MBG9980892.1 helix-turn-helix domain-containing protein [Facklamia lactis]MBG9986745.1 helix-turn-helix domain-containing protein [Facklamia lactis]
MENLFNKQQRRQLELIKFLYQNQEWLSFKQIQKVIDCSSPIIKEDLNHFNNKFSEFLKIHITSNGALACFEPNISFEHLFAHYMSEATPFRLLEYIFYYPRQTIEELAEVLYTSSSTIYRMIQTIKSELEKNYAISITTNPVTLIGNEVKIRNFYAEFFNFSALVTEWPFFHLERNIINQFISVPMNLINSQYSFAQKRQIAILVTVNITRIQQGNFVSDKLIFPDRHHLYQALIKNKHFAKTLADYEERFDLTLDERTIMQIFYNYLHVGVALSYEELQNEERFANSYQSLQKLTQDLSKDFDLTLEQSDLLILSLHNAARMQGYTLGYYPLLIDMKSRFKNSAAAIYPIFFKQVEQYLVRYLEVSGIEPQKRLINYLVYVLYTHWPSLFNNFIQKTSKPKLLILSKYDFFHEHLIRDIIEVHFGNMVQIVSYKSKELNHNDLENVDADIIITNFTVDKIKNKKVICYHNFPSLTVMENIQKAILQYRYNIYNDLDLF